MSMSIYPVSDKLITFPSFLSTTERTKISEEDTFILLSIELSLCLPKMLFLLSVSSDVKG
jgi:hypothetical protein